MKKSLKRLLSFAMALLMVLSLVPVNGLQVYATETDGEESSTVEQSAGDMDFTDATADESGEGWAWANAAKTLTLSGAAITSAVTLPDGAAIVAAEGTESSIVVTGGDAPVTTSGDLKISGSGKLTIKAVAAEVSNLAHSIAGAESITVDGTELTTYGFAGLNARHVAISNAKVDIKGYGYAIYSKQTTGSTSVVLDNVSGTLTSEADCGIELYVEYNADNSAEAKDEAKVVIKNCEDLTILGEQTRTDKDNSSGHRSAVWVYTRDAETDAYVYIDDSDVVINGSGGGIYVNSHSDNSESDDASAAWVAITDSTVAVKSTTYTWAAIFVNNNGTGEKATADVAITDSTVSAEAVYVGIMTSTKDAASTVNVEDSNLTVGGANAGIRVKANYSDKADAIVKGTIVKIIGETAMIVDEMDNGTSSDATDESVADGSVIGEPAAQVGDVKYATLAEAVAAANAIEGGATVTLLGNVTVSEKLTIKENVTISGAYTITRGIAGTIFAVDKNATLTLDGGVVIDGGNNWTFDSENFYADLAAAKTLSTGAKNGYSTSAEGGLVSTAAMITVSGTKGAVVMNKATIQNVWADNHNNGALFSVPAGATLTMNKGALIQNIRGSVAGQMKGTWTMNDGKITGVHGHNTNGCLTDIRGGSFTINGGEICNNTLLGLNNNGSGILAQVYGTDSKLIVNGGNIHDNANFCPGGGWGSIVYLNRGGNFEMNGGTIGNGNSDKCTTIGVNDPSSTVALNAGTINVAKATAGTYDSLLLGNVTIGEGMTISGGDVRFCGTVDNTLVINGTVNSNVLLRAENVTNNGVVNGNVTITKDSWVGNDGSVTISGGTWNGTFTVEDGAALSITGGTFKNDPSAWLAEDCKVSKLADGTYGVEALKVTKVSTKAELDAAIAAAEAGDVIRLTADIDYGTTQLAITKAITLDLGEHTLTTRNAYGGMSVKNNATIKNGTIVHASNTAAIKVWNATAFEDLVIDVQGKGDANKTIGGIVLQSGSTTCVGSIKNVTIKGAALTNGIETYNCGNATEPVIGSMENVTIDAVGTGMLISAPCGTATNCSIKGGVSGIEIWIKGTYSASLNLVDCDVEGGSQAVYAHDEFNSNPNIVNNGTLKLTADEDTAFTGGLTEVINRITSQQISLPEALTSGVAKVNGKYFDSLKDAVAAANAIEGGATVTLLKNVTLGEKLTISGNVTLSGAYTITRADTYTGTLFAVNAGATLTLDGELTIDGNNNWTLNEELYNKALNREATGVTWADLITSEEGKPNATAPMFKVTGSVVAKNVTIQNNYSDKSSNNGDYGVFQVDANATLTMTGATVKHIVTGGANSVAHLSTNSVWTVNDGTLISDTFAGKNGGICRNDSGKLVMNGGTICTNRGINTNGTVVMLYKGSMEMNGGTICHNTGISGTANGRCAPIYGHSTSTFVMTGGTIKENQGISYGGVDVPSSIKVEISGGYIGDNISSLGNTNADVNGNANTVITGGTFTQDVSQWLAPDLGMTQNADGEYVLTEDLYEYNGTKYKTLAEVIAAIAATPATMTDESTTPVVTVLASHKVSQTAVIETNITLDLNGKNIYGYTGVNPVIRVLADVTVTGNGMIDSANQGDGYCFIVGNSSGVAGNLTIENGTFKGTTTAISVTRGTATILDGDFRVKPYTDTNGNTTYDYLLNCIDANYKTGDAKIIVKGGVFTKFNPENNAAEGANTNFCPVEYTGKDDDGDGIYTVVPYVNWVKAQLLDGKDVTLDRDIVVDGSMIESIAAPTNGNGKYPNFAIFTVIGDKVTFDLNGHTITYNGHKEFQWKGKTYSSCAVAHGLFFANAGADLTVTDSSAAKTGTVMVYGLASGAYVASPNTTFTITGGKWINKGCQECGGTNLFLYPLQGGELYITGGHFEQDLDANGDSYLIVVGGGNYKNSVIDYSKTKIEISGGTFVGMNPEDAKYFYTNSNNQTSYDQKINACDEGFKAEKNADGTYGVVVDPAYGKAAKIGDTYYVTLQAAIDAAQNGDTITLLADCAENVTVVQKPDVAFTIDGNDKTMSGTITVDGKSAAYATAGLTIKNVKFDATNISKDASINLGGSNTTRYTSNVTVENCSFTGTGNAKVGIKNYTGGCKNLTVTDCTAEGLHSLVQVKGVSGIAVKNVTVNGKNGISVGTSTNVVIENANITAAGYGIRADGTGAYTMTVKACTIRAELPVVVRNATGAYALTVEGGTLTADNTNGYQVIFTNGDDGTYEVPTGTFVANVDESVKCYPVAEYVASVTDGDGNVTYYMTLADAIADAKAAGTTVTVLKTIVLTEDGTLDLQGVRLNAASSIRNAPVFRVLADVTVTNGIVDGRGPVEGEGGINCYAFIVGNSTTAGTLTIADGTYRGVTSAISITNGTVNISGGIFQTGHDGEGTDYGAQYLLNCMDAAYKNGTAVYNITGGRFNYFNPENNAAEGANTNFLAGNYKASDYKGDNKWTVTQANVVMDGDKYFATIKDALAILASADTEVHTVKLLKDLDIDVNYSTYNYPILVNGFSVELDLNGKTLTADWSKYTGSRKDNALIGVANGGKLTIIDSVDGGKIVNNDNRADVENRIFWIITSTKDKSIEVTIKGGTFVQNETNTALLYVQGNKPSDNLAPIYVTIEGGRFETINDDFFNAYDGFQHNSTIVGGTFNKNPSDWEIKIPAEYAAAQQADGTWTIVDAVACIGGTGYATFEDALAAAEAGDTITVLETIVLTEDGTIDLKNTTVQAAKSVKNAPVFRVLADVTVTNGTVDGTTGINSYAFIVGNSTTAGTLNIADGTYKGVTSAISITNGTANISGGEFSTGHDGEGTDYGAQYLLNCMDAAYKAGTAVYNITGGTFVGFNPENNAAEGANTNFVAKGYKAVDNGDGTYGVKVTLPEVAITDIKNTLTGEDPDLTFALNFKIKDLENLSNEYLEDLMAVYGSYYVDYVLTIGGLNGDSITFNANGNADGYLAGQYDAYGEAWVTVPFSDVVVNDGESLYIMEYAAKLMGKQGLRFTLAEVAAIVQNFDCGVYFTPEFLEAHPDLDVTLQLKVFTEDAEGNKIENIDVATNEFENNYAAAVSGEGKQTVYYATFAEAYADAQAGDTVELLADAKLTGKLTINKGITIDGNGCSIIADETAVWYTVSGKLNLKNYKTHLLGLNADGITLKDVVLDCNNNAAGINVYCAQNVVFDNVQIINATKGVAGLTVNGSTLTAKSALTISGNSVAIDISNGSGVTSALGMTIEAGTVTDLGDKTVKFASAANNDMTGAVDADGNPYFAAVDNAYYYTQAQIDSRTSGYTNGLKLLDDVTLSKDVTIGSTLNLNDNTLTVADGKALKISGNLTVTGEGSIDGTIQLTKETATLTAPAGMDNVVSGVEGYKVTYSGEVYMLVNENTVAWNMQTGTEYETVAQALLTAQNGQTVQILVDCAETIVFVYPGVTLDLNGCKLTANYVAADFVGSNIIDSSKDNTGLLVVADTNVNFAMKNKQIAVKTDEGYRFFDVALISAVTKNYQGTGLIRARMMLQKANTDDLLAQLIADSNGTENLRLELRFELSWTGDADTTVTQAFRFSNGITKDYVDKYVQDSTGTNQSLDMYISGAEGLANLTITPQIVLIDLDNNAEVVISGSPRVINE